MKKKIEIHDDDGQGSPVKEQADVKKVQDTKKTEAKPDATPVDPKDAQIADLVNHLQHLQAEFENFKKRIDQDKKRFCDSANESFIMELISVIDSFEMALKTESGHDDFYRGVELIYDQLWSILEKNGLTKMEVEGVQFDPRFHEALLTEASDSPSGTVLEELQAGYLLNGKLLISAKVKVAKSRQ